MLINNTVDEPVQGGPGLDEPLVQSIWVHPPKKRYKIRNIKGSEELRKLLKYGDELLLPFGRARPERRPVNDVLGEVEHELAHVDWRPGPVRHGPDDTVGLVPDRLPRLGPLAAEQAHDAQLAHLPPEGAVVGEGHVGPVVGEVADGDGGGPVREYVILGLEDLSGHVRARDHDHVDEPHL
uniref:Uncharacterized protein n=1 Tax=Opuntia streptacantha TaxID=393608 RepID=A0A7C9E550_OPUST